MQVNIILFGQLAEIAGQNSLAVEDIDSTDQLVQAMHIRYPAMRGIPYVVAVNRKAVRENTALTAACTVALLPPFSGG